VISGLAVSKQDPLVMSSTQAIRTAIFTMSVVGGLGFLGGCGSDTPPTGAVIAEDPKIYQDRQKAMANSYKTPPPSPFRR
jgi:hypothetical protein